MTGAIRVESHGEHVALIRIERPEARNALSPKMLCELADAFLTVRADPDVRAVVLTGSGDVAFCSGGDLGLTLPLEEPGQSRTHRRGVSTILYTFCVLILDTLRLQRSRTEVRLTTEGGVGLTSRGVGRKLDSPRE